MDSKALLTTGYVHFLHTFLLPDRLPSEASVVEKLEKELSTKNAALRDWHMNTTPIGITNGTISSSVLHHEAEDEGEEAERSPGNEEGDAAGRG